MLCTSGRSTPAKGLAFGSACRLVWSQSKCGDKPAHAVWAAQCDNSGCGARRNFLPVVQAERVEVQPLERCVVSTTPQSSLPLLL